MPSFSDMPTTITLADAPMAEPFPPRHVPNANNHQSGIRSAWCRSWIPERSGQSCFTMSIINGFPRFLTIFCGKFSGYTIELLNLIAERKYKIHWELHAQFKGGL